LPDCLRKKIKGATVDENSDNGSDVFYKAGAGKRIYKYSLQVFHTEVRLEVRFLFFTHSLPSLN